MITDLHFHSHLSDGIHSPEELFEKATQAGIELFALTDHDTIEGNYRLLEISRQSPIKMITGIEFSARWKCHDIHILGYNFEINAPIIQSMIDEQNMRRIGRAKEIAAKIEALGFTDVYAKTCEIAGHERLARPHFAQFLVNEKVVPDMQTAFKHLLRRGKPAFVPTIWLSLHEVVSGINEAGGQAVIAHPLKYKLTATKLKAFINNFKEAGGVGMEVISGIMTMQEINYLARLCEQYELLASSGSDYHGDFSSKVMLGRQMRLPVNCNPIWHQWTN